MSEMAGAGTGRGSLSLEHLVALNDEIKALVRTGLPLESGLRAVGDDLSGRLGGIMKDLAGRMSRGASLLEALEAEGDRLPGLYRGVVEAGLRSGRLSAALECLAEYVRAYLDSRRAIGMAVTYPMIVLTLAYGLFVMLVTFVMPRFLGAFAVFRIPIPAALHALTWLGTWAGYWWPILPVLLAIGVGFWAWTGTSAGFRPSRTRPLLGWFPWMRTMLRSYEAANFADLLAMLIAHGVPYPDALRLATEATGDTALVRLGRDLAAGIERGDPPGVAPGASPAMPPLLLWLLTSGRQQSALADSLRGLATIYRKRAEHEAGKIRVYLPIVLLVGVGLSATLIFGLSLFVPFAELLRNLSVPE